MWSAVNWLSAKAGINLEDTQEVINCTTGYDSTQTADMEHQGTETSGKENQMNGSTLTGTPFKKRWRPHKSPNNVVGNPLMVPLGSGSRTPTTSMHSQSMSPISVAPPRKSLSPGGYGTPSLGFGGAPLGSRHSPPASWKEMSMNADVSSPGFAFRVVRQAEKSADLSTKMYPTVQERHLHSKHRPNIRLKGAPKPVLTPNKPKSVAIIPIASSPTRGNPNSSPLFTQQLPAHHVSDFRPTDFFVGSPMRTSGTSFPDLLEATSAATNLALANLSREECDYDSNGDLTVSKGTLTNIAVTAALTMSDNMDLARSTQDEENSSDPTSLKSVLAALSTGKGVKRSRVNDFDDTEHKRPCAEETSNYSYSGPSPASSQGPSASSSPGYSEEVKGGEKRALEMSSNSESSFQQVSPCAKIARTSGTPNSSSKNEGEKRSREDTGSSPINKRRCVNPRLASMSSSRKMLQPIGPMSDFKPDLQLLDCDSEMSGSSIGILDDSMENGEDDETEGEPKEEGSTKGTDEHSEGRTSPTDTQQKTDAKELSHTSLLETIQTAPPHIVSLNAHRADKKSNQTRLNRMLGLLFNMTDEEVQDSTPKVVDVSPPSVSNVLPTSSIAFSMSSAAPVTSFSNSVSEAPKTSTANDTDADALSRAKTLPVTELQKVAQDNPVSNSVAAAFRFNPPKAEDTSDGPVQSKLKEKSLPSYNDSVETPKKDATVDGSNPLLAFLANNVKPAFQNVGENSSPSKEPPASKSDGFSISATATETNPLLKNNQPTNPLLSSSNQQETFKAPVFSFGSPGKSSKSPSSGFSLSGNLSKDSEKPPPPFNLSASTFTAGNPLTSENKTSSTTATSSNLPTFSFTPKSNESTGTTSDKPAPSFSFGSNVSSTEASATETSKAPPSFSFGSAAKTAAPQASFSFGSVTKAQPESTQNPAVASPAFSFGSETSKASTQVSSALTFSFGNAANAPKATESNPSSSGGTGLTFGSKTTTNAVTLGATSTPSSGFQFGSATATSKTNESSGSDKPSFSFGSVAASTESTVAAPTFSFGNLTAKKSEESDKEASTKPATVASFSFGKSTESSVKTASGGFSLGGSTAATNASSTFGAAATNAPSTFGATTTKAPPTFGAATTNASSTFGAATVNAPSTFGATTTNAIPTFGATTTNAPTFGAAATNASSTFGAAATNAPSFGAVATNAPSTFGAAIPTFGSGTSSSASLSFGNGAPSSLSFGSSTTNPGTKPTSSNSLFSNIASSGTNATSTNSSTASFVFGSGKTSTQDQPSKTVTFGNTQVFKFAPDSADSSKGSGNLFGQPTSASQASSSLFGQPAPPTSGGSSTSGATPFQFGGSGAASATGSSSSTFSFGSNLNKSTPTFGFTQNQATPAFGSTQNQATLTFGSMQNQATPTFESTQNQAIPTFGSTQNQAIPSFGSTQNQAIPSFGSIQNQATPTLGSTQNQAVPTFGSTPNQAVPTFGSTHNQSNSTFGSTQAQGVPSFGNIPSFGSSSTQATPNFGSVNTQATPTFGSASTQATPTFGNLQPTPTFGSVTSNPTFGSPAPNTFGTGSYMQTMLDQQNLFSVGGTPSNASAARRPRIRAHRRNK